MPRARTSGWMLCVAILVTLAVAPAPAAAGPDHVGRPAQPSPPGLRLELIGQRFSFEPDGDIHLVYRLVGDLATLAELTPPDAGGDDPEPADGDAAAPGADPEESPPEPPPPIPLVIQVANYPPLGPTDSVDPYVGGDVDPDDFQDAVDGILVTDLRERARFHDDGSISFELTIPTDVVDSQPEKLKFAEPGLHPVRVQLRVGAPEEPERVATHGTIVQRLPGADEGVRPSEPIDLSLLAAIEDPGPLSGDATRSEADGELAAIAASAEAIASPFTLALPPSVVTPATDGPLDQERLAAQLADDELQAMPAVPFDVSAAVAADKLDAFALDLRQGEDLLTTALPTVPSRRDVWLATGPLSADGAQALRDLGVRMLVMPPDLYRDSIDPELPETDRFVEIALPDGGSLPLLVIDPLGVEFTEPATSASLARATGVEWSVSTISDLLLDQLAGSTTVQRSRMLATPDLTAPDPRLVVALESMASTTPSVRFTPATALTGVTDVQQHAGEPVSVELPTSAGASITERVALLRGTAFVMANAASMLAPDDPRPAEWTAALDSLVPTAYTDAHVESVVEGLLAEADALTSAVVPPEPFTFTLTGRSGDIDMRLGNTGDETLKVKLRLSSPKLTFPEGEQIVELRPDTETSVIVPVRARANGTSLVTVEILTPVDQPLTEPVMVTSRVNALTGLGQVLTGGLIVVLLTWWFNHWRTRRRTGSGDDGSEPDADDDGGAATDALTDVAGEEGTLTGAPTGPAADLPPPGE